MGTWGSGNFECDDALDILEAVSGVIHPEIDGFLESSRVGIEDLSAILACIAIENALVQQCSLEPRGLKSATELRDKVLAIYADEAEGFTESIDFLTQRKAEIESTLETMMNASKSGD